MKLSTELKNLPIVSIAEGEEVGMVKDFIVDPVAKAVVALVIADSSWYAGAKVISFSLINSIGDYAITTENSSSVVELVNMPELIDLLKKELKISDARIITRGGRYIGRVKEYSIDERSGMILGLELSSDAEIPSPDRNVIPAGAIVTIGKDVIIVNDDVEVALAAGHIELSGVAPAARPAPRPAAPKPVAKPIAAPSPSPVAPIRQPERVTTLEEDLGLDPSPEHSSEPARDEAEVDIEELLDLDSSAEVAGLVEEPVEVVRRAAPARAQEGEDAKESLSDIFERRQIKYMLGKNVSRDIESDDGAVIASQGQAIDDSVIQRAKKAGKFLELSMNIEIED